MQTAWAANIFFTFLIGSLVMYATALRYGVVVTLFSPAFIFFSIYSLAFIFRPPFMWQGISTYEFADDASEYYNLAQILGTLGMVSFAFGLLIWYNLRIRVYSTTCNGSASPQGNLYFSKGAGWLSLIFTCAFILILSYFDIFDLDFNTTRMNYTHSLSGNGYIYLIDELASIFLLQSFATKSSQTRRIEYPMIFALILFVLVNITVSNRSLVTSIFAGFMMIYVFKLRAVGKSIRLSRILIIVLLIVILGAAIGIARGMSDYKFSNHPFALLIHFLLTFDFFETFSHSLKVFVSEKDWGVSWLEDAIFVFLPRAIFPDKPHIYGSNRLQATVFPESVGDGIFTATYPIGLYGESYANFGLVGLVLVPILLAWALCFIFDAMSRTRNKKLNFLNPLTALCLYTLLCINGLLYFRSIGWFIAHIGFIGILSILARFTVSLISEALRPRQQDRVRL